MSLNKSEVDQPMEDQNPDDADHQEQDQELLNIQRRKTVPKFVLEEFVKVDDGEASLSDGEEEKTESPMALEDAFKNETGNPLKLTKRTSSFYKTKSVIHCDSTFDKLPDAAEIHSGLRLECPIQDKLASPSSSASSQNK